MSEQTRAATKDCLFVCLPSNILKQTAYEVNAVSGVLTLWNRCWRCRNCLQRCSTLYNCTCLCLNYIFYCTNVNADTGSLLWVRMFSLIKVGVCIFTTVNVHLQLSMSASAGCLQTLSSQSPLQTCVATHHSPSLVTVAWAKTIKGDKFYNFGSILWQTENLRNVTRGWQKFTKRWQKFVKWRVISVAQDQTPDVKS